MLPISFYTLICLILTLMYVALIGLYTWGWHRLPTSKFNPRTPQSSVCIIVPARNEADKIGDCLEAIQQQKFPPELLEVIVIDDHSSDETPNIVLNFSQKHRNFNLKLLKLADILPKSSVLNAYKKKAIEIAIAHTNQELIVTTDADVTMGSYWLSSLVNFYEEKRPHLIAGPVCFTSEKSTFERFQSLDFMGMLVATGASVHLRLSDMCNGANLTYRKKTFEEVNGFQGIDDIASGDDMLLMNKIAAKYPDGITFLKSRAAIVWSYPQATLKAFANQRLRWASKTSKYKDKRITIALAGVYFFNMTLLINFILTFFCNVLFLKIFLLQFLSKCLIDFLFLGSGARFFQRKDLLWLFLPSQFFHILYILIIGTLGNFGSYTWKGRKVK